MIAGWCPVRAYRCRRRRDPTDWLLLVMVALLIGYSAAAAWGLVCKLGGW